MPVRTVPPPVGGNGRSPKVGPDELPHCDYCNDLRLVKLDVQPGHPVFGTWIACPKCREMVQRARLRQLLRKKRERIGRYSQLVGRACRQTFANFDRREREDDTDAVRHAYRAAQAFAEEPSGWLLLHGSRGTGKSHLAAAIANHLRRNGVCPQDGESPRQPSEPCLPPTVLFMTVPRLLNLLRSGFKNGDYDDLLDLVLSVDVLILDDLGVEQATDWAQEMVYTIVNHRYQMMTPMVVVTNLPPEALERRIQDRLLDDDFSTVVKVVAPTYRQRESRPGRIL